MLLSLKRERGEAYSSWGVQIDEFQPCSFSNVPPRHTLLGLKAWFVDAIAKPYSLFSTLLKNDKAVLELWNKTQFLQGWKVRV